VRVVLDKIALRSQPRGKTPTTVHVTQDYRMPVDIELDGRGVLHQHTRILCGKEHYYVGVPAKLGPNLRLQLLQLLTTLSVHFEITSHPYDADFEADRLCLIARRQPGLASSIGLWL